MNNNNNKCEKNENDGNDILLNSEFNMSSDLLNKYSVEPKSVNNIISDSENNCENVEVDTKLSNKKVNMILFIHISFSLY